MSAACFLINYINAYYTSLFTSFYIDLITIDAFLLNLNRCYYFSREGKCRGADV